MQVAFFAFFPGGHDWRNMAPAVVFFLLATFFPGQQSGEIIQQHLGEGNELELPDRTKLRFVVLDPVEVSE